MDDFGKRGGVFYNEGNYKSAIQEFDKAIEQSSDNAKYYNFRGMAYFGCKQYYQAIADYERALELDPGNRDIERRLAAAREMVEPPPQIGPQGGPIVVPEIPEKYKKVFKNKPFCATDIKWVKTVTDKNVHYAYLHPDPRVKNGVFFCLELNSKFEDSFYDVRPGDLILLHQRLKPNNIKCFTHLVTPIRDEVIQSPYGGDGSGRWVQAIAMTGNRVENSIRFIDTVWKKMGFTGPHSDLSHGDGRVWEITYDQQLSKLNFPVSYLQKDIWDIFQHYRK
jgi:tetratricopeptide (TPR) repeat protein